jgi:hypothetical protein
MSARCACHGSGGQRRLLGLVIALAVLAPAEAAFAQSTSAEAGAETPLALPTLRVSRDSTIIRSELVALEANVPGSVRNEISFQQRDLHPRRVSTGSQVAGAHDSEGAGGL